jgi:CRP-like cAMP-binding protein
LHVQPETHPLSNLVRKLSAIGPLSEEEAAHIYGLPAIVRDFRAGHDLVREGDTPSQACVMLEGLSCRFKIVGEGAKQVFSYHIPGDIPDLQSLHISSMDHTLGTLAPSKVAFVPHRALRNMIVAHPRLGGLLWRDTLVDGSIFREWLCNIGRRSALARIAHMICELHARYDKVGMVEAGTIPFPLTQANLGDAQGLSVVHVNRVMRELKARRLISVSARQLTVLDWEALTDLGDFDPAYLHFTST